MQLSPRMSNAMTLKSSSTSPMREVMLSGCAEDAINDLPVTVHKYGVGSGGSTRARRKTPKASEAKLTKESRLKLRL